MDLFVLLKFLSNAALPPASTAIGVIGGGALFILGWKRIGKTIIAVAVLIEILASLPPVGDALMAPLERQATEAARRAKPCCYSAIVLLGGGVIPAMPPAMPASHLIEGADRTVFAAQLFHRKAAPRIIVSGGKAWADAKGQSEADAMRQLLVQLGVPADDIVLEDKSYNTIDNIAFVKAIVGGEPVALVTSAYHMPRALRLARRFGLDASAFPTDWNIPWAARPAWHSWLPSLAAEEASTVAAREYLAALFDRR